MPRFPSWPSIMDEFDLIKTYFAPLAKGFTGSLNLTDDAALLSLPLGCELVVTTDAINRGVHFIGDEEDPALIARKLLRVNLSDLAAMGATPLCYFLALMLPEDTESQWVKRFAEGLHEDQSLFRIHLAGGDTSATKEGMSFCVTAMGSVPAGKALRRSGAKIGDAIYVSGTLGDSALGLQLLQHKVQVRGEDKLFLEERYFLPEPRLELGQKLIGIASACMDVSDGLVQDLGHICEISGVGATVQRDKLPLSAPAKKLIEAANALWNCALAGGDDYELLFTASSEKELLVRELSAELGLPLTKVGEIIEGTEVGVRDKSGRVIPVKHKGFQHF